jgi:hypothetical protein
MADDIQTWPTSITWPGNSTYISSHWKERRFDSHKLTIDLIIWKGPWFEIMTSVDADLRSGHRLETGRRSESMRYILNDISFILYSFLSYPHCWKKHSGSAKRFPKPYIIKTPIIWLPTYYVWWTSFAIGRLFLSPICSFIRVSLQTSYRCFLRKNEKKLSLSCNVTFHYADDVLS